MYPRKVLSKGLTLFSAPRLRRYGLAEHTVYVCDGSHTILTVERDSIKDSKIVVVSQASLDKIPTETPEHCQNLVSCGNVGAKGGNLEVKLLIVDMKTGERKPDGEVGEIWIDSPSKAAGYVASCRL